MKEYATEYIRNIALVSHSGGGKTSLGEAMLYLTGAITRMGKVEDGNTVSDFEDEEIRRSLSLSTSILPVEYKDHKINVLDTPGYTDFVGEVISALRVADSAVVLVDSVAGVEVGTEIVWGFCDTFKLPRFVVISKMNRDNANFKVALDSARGLSSSASLIPVQLPWGEKHDFKGVIDLFRMQAISGNGGESEPIPDEYQDAADEARIALVEAAAEGDDVLLEKYLEGEELSAEEVTNGFRKAVLFGQFVPVLVTASTAGLGIEPLLEMIIELLPSPANAPPAIAQGASGEQSLPASDTGQLAVYVWKTTADPFVGKLNYMRIYSGTLRSDTRVWNHKKGVEERLGTLYVMCGKGQKPVKIIHAGDIGTVAKLGETDTGDTLGDKAQPLILPTPEYPNALFSVAVSPKTQADSTKISPTLTRLCEEDPTLSWHQESSTNQTILQGMGDQHIDVAIRKAESKFQVGLSTKVPRVPYRETITKEGRSQYRHKKQTGGSGQFAEVHMRIEPLEEEEFEFVSKVFGGAISSGYMPAIEKGVRRVMRQGVVAGYPVEKVKVFITDGKEHPVDSKAVAFEIAGREAFKLAVKDAAPVLLEPVMDIRVTVPEANMGDVLGDLNSRRARVQGMETERGRSVVTAQVPLAEIQRYTTDLRSMTGGRGFFTMTLSHYQVVPPHVTEEIIAARQREISKQVSD
ncbi:MAG: elongation factor G [Anaerolineales bacterium]|nr:MAG: elongation factor G [Anaerolineales bacterium]